MKSLIDILSSSTEFLETKGIEGARRVAEGLISHVLGVKRMDLYLQHDRPLEEEELEQIRPLLKRALLKEPVQYIIGEVDFYGVKIHVNPDVLIPRQETEILIDLIVKKLEGESLEGKQIWDVCTGSGCIGIALKKKLKTPYVRLSDYSQKALDVARENALLNQVDVEIIQSDLLSSFQGKKADVIVCNPPYVSCAEYEELEPSVKGFEPQTALKAGATGLDFYKRLKEDLPLFLNSKAKIFFEIGMSQGKALLDLFSDPHWTHRSVHQDWVGHDRFFFLEFQ